MNSLKRLNKNLVRLLKVKAKVKLIKPNKDRDLEGKEKKETPKKTRQTRRIRQ